MFAALNVIRLKLMSALNLPRDFELSYAYLFFYDKFERCNFFLEKMIELRDEPTTSPVLSSFFSNDLGAICDGGCWPFFVNIISKYGAMPITKFDECYNTMCTKEMNSVLLKKISIATVEMRKRSNAKGKRAMTPEQVRKFKDTKIMPEIYKVLVNFMGVPPKPNTEFTWEYRERSTGDSARGKFHRQKLTPLQFYHDLIDPLAKVSSKIMIAHDPRKEKNKFRRYKSEH